MKWINVKEKLPPTIPNQGYLVLITDGFKVAEGFLESNPPNESHSYIFKIIGQEKGKEGPFITHWMPLPPPPSEDFKKNE